MPRPPYTKFPKDAPLPLSQRGELTKAFNSRSGGSSGGTAITNIVEQATGGGGGGGNKGTSTGGPVTLAGDVTGPSGANTIAKIQGNPLAPQAIQSGQAYVLVAGVLVPSNLGGDVAGSLVQNTVQGIQTVPVANTAPMDQQELVYDASAGSYAPGVNPGAALHLWANCT